MFLGNTHIPGKVANKNDQQRDFRKVDELEENTLSKNLRKGDFKTMWFMFVNVTEKQNRTRTETRPCEFSR